MSIPKITHTQISNEFIDKFMPDCTGGEVKVFLAIARQTIGWHKETDDISLSQMEQKTGLSRKACIMATDSLAEKGIVVKIVGKRMTSYSINYEGFGAILGGEKTPSEEKIGEKSTPIEGQIGVERTPKSGEIGVKSTHTKERLKEKERERKSSHEIQKLYREAGSEYYHDGREAKAVAELSPRYEENPGQFALMVIAHSRLHKNDKFFKRMPLSPSVLLRFWNDILEYRKSISSTQAQAASRAEPRMADGRTTAEYLAQVEAEEKAKKEAGVEK